jgi:hypothetical protein
MSRRSDPEHYGTLGFDRAQLAVDLAVLAQAVMREATILSRAVMRLEDSGYPAGEVAGLLKRLPMAPDRTKAVASLQARARALGDAEKAGKIHQSRPRPRKVVPFVPRLVVAGGSSGGDSGSAA